MPTVFMELILFLSSYAPLWVIFGILGTFGTGIPSIAFYALAGLSATALALFMKAAVARAPIPLKIARVRPRDYDAISYIVTYLLPFLGGDFSHAKARVALGVLLIVIGVLYVRANLFYVNPLLSLVGYRLFELETSGNRVLVMLTRRRYVPHDVDLEARPLNEYVFLE
jgi:hypothetical protein